MTRANLFIRKQKLEIGNNKRVPRKTRVACRSKWTKRLTERQTDKQIYTQTTEKRSLFISGLPR